MTDIDMNVTETVGVADEETILPEEASVLVENGVEVDQQSSMVQVTTGGMQAAQQPDTFSLVSVFQRAASDPNTDMDKFQTIMAMMEKREDMEKMELFYRAMASAQSEMGPVVVDLYNEQTKSWYASYKAMDKVARPAYTRNGFGISFDQEDCTALGAEEIRIICLVSHNGGGHRKFHLDMDVSGKGAKGGSVMTKTHAKGSAVAYARRYLLGMIFNVASGLADAEDDGNRAGVKTETISEDQQNTILAMLTENNVPGYTSKQLIDKADKWIVTNKHGESIETLHAAAYEHLVRQMKQFIAKQNKRQAAS